MEFNPHYFQHIKLGVHIAQMVFIFVAWVIEIAVFRSSAKIDGRPGWFFGLCFLTIPAVVYETMTPRFPRTRKFAHPYGLAAVDAIFTIMWLSAFAAVASFNSSGKCGDGCKLSEATVGLGVFVWLLFVLTTVMSVYAVSYYNREGYLPGLSRAPLNSQMIDPDKDAFSTAPHDDYAPVHNADEHEIPDYPGPSGVGEQRYNEPQSSYSGEGFVPTQAEETGYTGYGGSQQDIGGRVQFPTARYDNI